MKATLFAGLLFAAVYTIFIVEQADLGYIFLGGAFLVYLYGIFRAALGHS